MKWNITYSVCPLSAIVYYARADDRKENFLIFHRKLRNFNSSSLSHLYFENSYLHYYQAFLCLQRRRKNISANISRSIPQKLLPMTLWFRYLTAEKSLTIKALIWSLRVEFGSCYLRRWSAESSFCRSESVYNRSNRVINITVTSQPVRCKITEMKSINCCSILVKSID